MVDFNRDATITTPPGEILKIAILERRAYFINAVEEFDKRERRTGSGSDHVLFAALRALFLEIQSALRKEWEAGEFDKMRERVLSADNVEDAVSAFDDLDAWLYSKNLTKFDTRARLLSFDVEGINRSHEEG